MYPFFVKVGSKKEKMDEGKYSVMAERSLNVTHILAISY